MDPRHWFARPQHVPLPTGQSLRLTGKRLPANPVEAWVADELTGHDFVSADLLIHRLAERWQEEEIRRGAWVVDGGAWGPWLYQREVCRALKRLEGDLIETVVD